MGLGGKQSRLLALLSSGLGPGEQCCSAGWRGHAAMEIYEVLQMEGLRGVSAAGECTSVCSSSAPFWKHLKCLSLSQISLPRQF